MLENNKSLSESLIKFASDYFNNDVAKAQEYLLESALQMKKLPTQQEQETKNRLGQLIGNTEEGKSDPVPTTSTIAQPIQVPKKIIDPIPILVVKDEAYYSNILGIKMLPTKGKHLGFKAPLNFALTTQRQFDVFEKVKIYQKKYSDTLIGSIIYLLQLGLEQNEKIENKKK